MSGSTSGGSGAGGMVFKEKVTRAPMNREPLWSNKYIKRYDTERKLKIHHDMVTNAQSTLKPYVTPPTTLDLEFMKAKFARKFLANERQTEIVRQNIVLLKALADIQSEDVKIRRDKRLRLLFKPPNLMGRKQLARKREAQRITKLNIEMLKRLYEAKPVYNLNALRKQAAKQIHFRQLRSQFAGNTAGFISPIHSPEDRRQPVTVSANNSSSLSCSCPSTSSSTVHTNKDARPPTMFMNTESPVAEEMMTAAARLKAQLVDAEQAIHKRLSRTTTTTTTTGGAAGRRPSTGGPNATLPYNMGDGSVASANSLRGPLDATHYIEPVINFSVTKATGGDMGTASHRQNADTMRPGTRSDRSASICSTISTGSNNGSTCTPGTAHKTDTLFEGPLVLSYGEEDIPCTLSIQAHNPFDGFFDLSLTDEKEAYTSLISLDDIEKLSEIVRKTENDDEVLRLHTNLLKIFHDADSSHKGKLKYNEFVKIMQRLDLGISGHELRMIIAEADENDDGVIDYKEFVPVAIELIQSFKARTEARKQVLNRNHLVDMAAFEQLHTSDLYRTVQMALENFEDIDRRGTGLLNRQHFKSCLSDPRLSLSKNEVKRILQSMPVDTQGLIMYGKFKDIFTEVKFQTIRYNVAASQITDVEKFLMELCKQAEKKKIGKEHERDEDVPFEGLITVREMTNILINSKHLILSRVQVACILSEAEVEDGMLDYWKFVPVAANIIQNMFSPDHLEQRSVLLKESNLSPQSLLHGKDAEEIENHLYRLFKLHDVDNSGYLDPKEFVACIQSLDLGLTISEMEALLVAADTKGNERVDYQDFVKLAYDSLLALGREKYLRALQKAAENKTREDGTEEDPQNPPLLLTTDNDTLKQTSDATKMARILQNLFTTADVAKKGYLTASEFRAVLESLELGITPFQMMMIMAEADENEDNIIQYKEFVPVCVELLQAFRAKAEIERGWSDLERKAERALVDVAENNKRMVDQTVSRAMALFQTYDTTKNKQQILSRHDFLKCIKHPSLELPRSEINMILHLTKQFEDRSPDKELGDGLFTSYKDFPQIMENVRNASFKRGFMNQIEPSALEFHLFNLFREEEAKDFKHYEEDDATNPPVTIMPSMVDGSTTTSSSNNSPRRTPQAIDTNGDELIYSNLLTIDRIRKTLESAKHLNLNRLQLLSIMSLVDVEPGTDSMMNYRKFSHNAALMINRLFDVNELKVRTEVVKKTEETRSIQLNITKEEFDRKLSNAIAEFDAQETGTVTFPVFLMCLQSIDHLSLSTGDYASIASVVPRDSSGNVFWKEFLKTAFEDILHLLQEKNIYQCMQRIKSQRPTSCIIPYLTRPQLVKYAENLVKDAQFSVVGNKLVVRPRKTHPKREIVGASPIESYTESMMTPPSPKGSKAAAQTAMEEKQRSTLLFSQTRQVEVVRQRRWDADDEHQKATPSVGLYLVRVLQGHPSQGKDVEVIITDAVTDVAPTQPSPRTPSTITSLQLKMPSIALADEDRAKAFAETLISRIIIQVDEQGRMKAAIRPYKSEFNKGISPRLLSPTAQASASLS